MDDEMVLSLEKVREKYGAGMSRTALLREVREGRFPPPVRLTKRLVGWTRDSLDGWLITRPVVTNGIQVPTPGMSEAVL